MDRHAASPLAMTVGEAPPTTRIVFSGDLGAPNSPLLPAPKPPERADIRAKVHTIGGYSAHADQNDLLGFIQGIPQAPKEIRLIHGERDALKALKALKAEIETWAQANHHAVEVTCAA